MLLRQEWTTEYVLGEPELQNETQFCFISL